MSNRSTLGVAVFTAALALAACGDAPTASPSPGTPQFSAVKFWDVGASASWNERATALAATRAVNVARLYAYLSLAQLRAAEAAEGIRPHPPVTAAISAASAAVLSAFFPLDVTAIEAALDEQEIAAPWPGAKHEDFASGEAIGRAIAARVMTYAAGDRVGIANPGTPPIGPGYWIWNGGPIARANYRARPFFLSSDDEFRPGPPPAFGSPAYQAALAEVRQIADTRTAAQLASAQYWNVNQSPGSAAAMNNLAVELIRSDPVPRQRCAV